MDYYTKIKKNWDAVAKPLDGMGVFEELTAKIGQIQQKEVPVTDKNVVFVLCADNGIVEEGISQSDQSVTAICAENIAKSKSTVGIMAKTVGADVAIIDVGINSSQQFENVRDFKIRKGTRNFSKEPAMTMEELDEAIETGKKLVLEYKNMGYEMICTGEMGIGNTTTSSAVAASLLGMKAEEVTGRGAGLSDEKLAHKKKVIADAIDKYQIDPGDTKEILRTLGGFDIATMCGVFLGGSLYNVPIVIDGFISMVAALAAERIVPGTKDCMIPSHMSKEPGVVKIVEELKLTPVIDGHMALGEGTGAVMMFSLLNIANEVYKSSFSFDEAGVGQYERF